MHEHLKRIHLCPTSPPRPGGLESIRQAEGNCIYDNKIWHVSETIICRNNFPVVVNTGIKAAKNIHIDTHNDNVNIEWRKTWHYFTRMRLCSGDDLRNTDLSLGRKSAKEKLKIRSPPSDSHWNELLSSSCLSSFSAAPSVPATIETCVQLENKIIAPPTVLEWERLDSRNHLLDH